MFYNGAAFILQDSNGEYTAPIVVSGTTYIPAHALEKLTGQSVIFDSSTKTLHVGDKVVAKDLPYHKSDVSTDLTQELLIGAANRTQTVQVTAYRNVTLRVRGSKVGAVDKVFWDKVDVWVPLKVVGEYAGVVVEWNPTLKGVDIYSEMFASAVSVARTMDRKTTYVPVGSAASDALGFRAWTMFNLVQDSVRIIPCRVRYGKGAQEGLILAAVQGEEIAVRQKEASVARKQVQALVAGLKLEGKTKQEKVYAIATWIFDNCEYLHSNAAPESDIYPRALKDVIASKYQICEGYARLFKEMCEAAGIHTQYLVGYVLTDGDKPMSHAWNRVFIDGQWLYCDLTFADGDKPDYSLLLRTEEKMAEYRTALIWDVRP